MKAQFIASILVFACVARAQSPTHGSTGVDGAFERTTPGVVMFAPRAYNPPLNPSGNNIFHFTNIYIGRDVTIKLSSRNLNAPVFWLAQGPVVIEGTIDLNGEDGGTVPALAGAGGYPGGAPSSSGYGPQGVSLNSFLIPLFGGSGGKGGETDGGGGGGGAILIASDTSITVDGRIIANGGASKDGSGGNGGAIRLVAPLIKGLEGVLSAKGGHPGGGDGAVRLETLDNRFEGDIRTTRIFRGKPLGLFLPPNHPPSVRIESIDGLSVKTQELNIHKPSSVRVGLAARNIPPGTVLELQCTSEAGESQSAKSSPLVGTDELSRATVEILLPKGSSRCLATTTWTNPPR
jgi:hypothetical protein